MLSMLIAYNAMGDVVATLDYMVSYDADGVPLGLVDFQTQEDASGEMTEVWIVSGATGSKTWPEWIGAKAHEFRVEREGPSGNKRITALVHKASGVRRERAAVESAIQDRITKANGEPADIRDLVGGPERPLLLDDEGRTKKRPKFVPSKLPIVPNLNGGKEHE